MTQSLILFCVHLCVNTEATATRQNSLPVTNQNEKCIQKYPQLMNTFHSDITFPLILLFCQVSSFTISHHYHCHQLLDISSGFDKSSLHSFSSLRFHLYTKEFNPTSERVMLQGRTGQCICTTAILIMPQRFHVTILDMRLVKLLERDV